MKIEVFHDTVCPWCRIGKANLQLALANWTGEPADITFRTFFLNPDIPPEGVDFRSYMQAKGGGRIPLESFFDRPREMGAEVGLTFNFEQINIAPNSLLSHRLIYISPENQREALIDAIYAAYFEHGRDIGQLEVLVAIADESGLNPQYVRSELEKDTGLKQIMADIAFAREVGISGVPFFILNDRYAFSGAQPAGVISRILKQVANNE